MKKELRELVKQLEAQGFETRLTKKGHLQVRRDGKVITVFAGTPSDHRSWANSMARIKKELKGQQ